MSTRNATSPTQESTSAAMLASNAASSTAAQLGGSDRLMSRMALAAARRGATKLASPRSNSEVGGSPLRRASET